jgi:hypothetical protein
LPSRNDGAALELDILDAQTHRLEDAHPRAVKKAADQAVRSMQAAQHCGYLLAGQHNGQSNGFLCALDAVQPGQLVAEHLLVQKKQRTLCLILRRRRDVVNDGKIGQEKLDLGGAHRRWVSLAVETDEASNPIDVRLLGADAVMAKADSIAYLVEQASGRWRCGVFRAGCH